MRDCLSLLAERKMVNQFRYLMFGAYEAFPATLQAFLVDRSPEEAAAELENNPADCSPIPLLVC